MLQVHGTPAFLYALPGEACTRFLANQSFVVQAHSEKSKVDLVARETFATPQLVKGLKPELNKKELGKAFKQQAKVRCTLSRET